MRHEQEAGDGRCKVTEKRGFKLLWREAGRPNHHDDKVDSDQEVVNEELSHSRARLLMTGKFPFGKGPLFVV